jgi:dihydropteroate synthase
MSHRESTPRNARLDVWELPRRVLDLRARPLVMGIVNVTPNSFSDGGLYYQPAQAIAHAWQLIEQGADILDIGGESTRPGSQPVTVEEELQRLRPVIQELAGKVPVPLSIDTSKAAVARVCLDLGVDIINDVTGLRGDPHMPALAAQYGAGVIVMHMQGTPQTMQHNPQYADVVGEIADFFQERLTTLTGQGLGRAKIVFDPGIGFGKTLRHNVEILTRLEEFRHLGQPLCLGVSRKNFLGKLLDRPTSDRLAGSLAVLCHALSRQAVDIVRVHEVAPNRDVIRLWQVLDQHGPSAD